MNPGDMRPYTSISEAKGPCSHELPHPLLVPVARVLRQRDALAMLCGEILATLKLPRNQNKQIKDLQLNSIFASWEKRLAKESGDANAEG